MIDNWLEDSKNGKLLPEKSIRELCDLAKDIFLEESNVQPVSAPVIICGDIHGQFYDLLNLFKVGWEIPNSKYIFLGDYVDRGYNSIETIQYLLCLKVKYPDYITLLRGNHESWQISFTYGFYEEVQRKYGNNNCWNYFLEVFDYLPLAALIEGEVLCIHGGLSPTISSIDQIRLINRRQDVPCEGALCDLLWSDPDDIETWIKSSRGAGWIFGSKVVKEFNHVNKLDLICRAHQLVNEGYKYWFDDGLVTVWSAPNYCYRCGNKASILKLGFDLTRNFEMFDAAERSALERDPKNCVPYFL